MEEKINNYITKVDILTVKFENILSRLEELVTVTRDNEAKYIRREYFDLIVSGLEKDIREALDRGRNARNWLIGTLTSIGLVLIAQGVNFLIKMISA